MGLWESIKSAGSAVKNTAMLPIDVAADVVSGKIVDGHRLNTEDRVKSIVRNVKDAYKETKD